MFCDPLCGPGVVATVPRSATLPITPRGQGWQSGSLLVRWSHSTSGFPYPEFPRPVPISGRGRVLGGQGTGGDAGHVRGACVPAKDALRLLVFSLGHSCHRGRRFPPAPATVWRGSVRRRGCLSCKADDSKLHTRGTTLPRSCRTGNIELKFCRQ